MSFGGRPAGGANSAPPDPLAALKLLAPSALDPIRPSAPRVTPSAFGDGAFQFFFFPFEH